MSILRCMALSVLLCMAPTLSEQNLLDSLFPLLSDDLDFETNLDRELRIESRVKRQEVTLLPPNTVIPATVPGFMCTTDLFRRMNECCRVPLFYPESINAMCTPQKQTQKVPLLGGIFRRLFPVKVAYRKNLSAKNKTIKATVEEICRIHCIFKKQNWFTPQNFIDENLMYTNLAIVVPQGPYNVLLNHARVECSSIQQLSGDIFASVNSTFGQTCYLNPFRMLRCIKRSMLLAYNTCPGLIQTGQKCDLAKAELRACDIFTV